MRTKKRTGAIPKQMGPKPGHGRAMPKPPRISEDQAKTNFPGYSTSGNGKRAGACKK